MARQVEALRAMPKCMYMYMCGMMMMALDTKAVQVERYTVTVTVAIAAMSKDELVGGGGIYVCHRPVS